MEDSVKKKIANHWDDVSRKASAQNKEYRTKWWKSPAIIRHINQTICGDNLEGWNAGAINVLKQYTEGRAEIAVSIGCGEGAKEMALLENNLVQKFICFELSKERIKKGKQLAEKKGLMSRILFVNADFFETEYAGQMFNMVFWDNSLHHMQDTFLAVKKSYEILEPGGIFFCNDFVGKSKFQWTDMELAIVNGIRLSLSDDIFRRDDGKSYPRFIYRPSIEDMNKVDPSEAADSSEIIPAIKRIFSDPLIIPTGGLIYHLCLNGILSNIEEDSNLLKHLLELDDETIRMGLTQYAFVLAKKVVQK